MKEEKDTAQQTLPKAEPRERWPLTFAERQMAVEQGMRPGTVSYNIGLAFNVEGPLDAERLEGALNALVAKRRILRSYYPLEDGEFTHCIAPRLTLSLEQPSCAEGQLDEKLTALKTPFDLAKPPLLRAALLTAPGGGQVLYLNIHHIILDGYSAPVFFENLCTLYAGGELPDEDRDFMDWAAWQAQNPPAQEKEKFFQEMFAGGLPENEMPTRPIRPEALPYVDSAETATMPAAKVKATAQKYGVSIFELLCGAAGITLAKYCGSEDVVLGTAMNGRTLPEARRMLGMFVNTLPIRLKPAGDQTAAAYLRETKSQISGVKARQDYPFERLVPQLAPERNTSRGPVFDLTLNYLYAMKDFCADGVTLRQRTIPGQALAVDLKLEVLNKKDVLFFELAYSQTLYEPQIVKNMLEQLTTTIERLGAANEDTLVMDAAELPDTQRRQILEDFAGPVNNAGLGHTVVGDFRAQAAKNPDAPALRSGEALFTYGRLDALTDALAAEFQRLGAKRGAVVGVLVHRNEGFVVGALAAMKSGAAYLPLDPSYPAERLEFMLEDTGAAIVFADEDLKGHVPGYGGAWVFSRGVSALPAQKPVGAPAGEDLVVLIYTSGTTGKPKGVMLTHANLMDMCAWCVRRFALTSADSGAIYASFGFDASLIDTYPLLTCGGQLHMVSEEMRMDLVALNNYFNHHGVTISLITTQLGRQFVEGMDNHSLRALSVGGETLVPIQPPENYHFYNQYGPTENTVSTTTFEVDKLYDRVPIGAANDNTCSYVVDKRGRLAPVGAPGELYIAGRGVAKGYLNRPELTAEKFVKNPFSNDEDYAVTYRSGDVVRFLPSGDLDFMGRRDFQVKIRGFRVELTEIEGRIRAWPPIKDAAVVPLDAPGGGKCAVAYVVADEPVDVEALNRFIEEELPPYMVPAATLQIEAIPLNPNGKVDRRKLPAPNFSAGAGETQQGSRAETELEKGISEIVREVLGHGQFGTDSNLLQLGLASLSAIKLNTLLHKKYGLAPSVKELMNEPTILGIENSMVRALLAGAGGAGAPAGPAPRPHDEESYPMTPAQEQMYVLRSTLEDPTTYNVSSSFRLPAGADEGRLLSAMDTLIRRHTGLRTYFESAEEGIRQKVAESFALEVLRGEASEAEASAVIDSWIRPFALDTPLLLRCGLLALEEGGGIFFLDVHHSITDGISLSVMMAELAALYEGRALPPVEIDYIDYSLWRQKTLDAAALKAHEDFWLARLEGELPYSELYPDFDRPAKMDHTGAVESCVIPAGATAALRALAARHGASVFTVMLAAWGFLLSRYTGLEDVVFGVPFSGRGTPGLDSVVGMFVSTQALRLKPALDETVESYLAAVARLVPDAQQHQDAAVGNIIAALGIRHDDARNPLYSTVFNFFTLPEMEGGFSLRPAALGSRRAHFDLDIEVREQKDGITVEAVYATSLYTPKTMQTLLCRFARLLELLPQSPGAALGALDLTEAPEREALQNGIGFAALPWEKHATYDALFRRQAAKTPDKTALVYKDLRLTYKQLNEISDAIAARLVAEGAGPEKVVGLLIQRSERFTLCALGVLKAGGAYMPIDQNAPPERVEYMLSDANALLVIADEALGHLLPQGGAPVLDAAALAALPAGPKPPQSPATPNSAFILLYTSGSTGNPKGAVLEHRSIVAFCAGFAAYSGLTEADVSAAYASFAFDASIMDVYPPLAAGGAVHIIPEDIRLNLPALNEYFEAAGVTLAFMTTQLGKQFIDNYALKALRHFAVGGEKLGAWARSDCRFYNVYGPTECTVIVNAHLVQKPELRAPVGRPLANLREYVLDKNGALLPLGMPGELGISGPGVMRGYLGREELNREKLLPNPFCDDPDYAAIYRTGDVVRWLENGEVDYLDRIDKQVKIRGYRIELGEIELRIQQQNLFDTMAVVDLDDVSGGKYLCCYYTAETDVDIEALKEKLLEAMPYYMVPTAFMRLDKIPLNQNGKVDRKALPKPGASGAGGEFAPPATETQARLCEIWQRVLGIESVGIQDNFYEVGGNSIKAVTLQVRIQKEMGAALPVSAIMKNPTVEAMARLIDEGAGAGPALPPVAKAPASETYPVTPPQQQMYILWQTLESKTAYNIPVAYKIRGALDAKAFSAAIDALVARHAALRTGFKEEGGEVVQFVLPPEKALCKKMFKNAREEEADGIIAEWVAPFNLAKPPLARFGLIQTGRDAHILFIDVHHIAADGLSLPGLLQDLLALYGGEAPEAPKLDYTDYAVWFQKNVNDGVLQKQKAFWLEQFADGVPLLDLPTDSPRPAVQQTAGAALRHRLSPALLRPLKEMASRHGATLFSVLLAAWATALARSAGAEELVVGVPHSGRVLPETETMPGMFVNTLPMLVRPSGTLSFGALVEQLAKLEQAVQDNQFLPLSELVDALKIPRNLSRNALFDVSFNYLQEGGEIRRGALTLESFERPIDSIHFDLTLTPVVTDSAVDLNLIYATSLFNEASAHSFLDRVLRVLNAAAANEAVTLHKIELLAPEERARLLEGFNANRFAPSGKTVCAWVDGHGQSRPNAPAVHDAAGHLTYGQLYHRSNALAAHVHGLAGAGSYVAVMLPRVKEIYLAELGVMKAGCAYLPIDPDYPNARIQTMLEDSGAKLLVTNTGLSARAGGFGLPCVNLDDPALYGAEVPFESLAAPDSIAYLIYTSGSTGKPKGVMVRHDGFANIMESFVRSFGVGETAVAAAYASFSFDVSIIDSYPFLVAGGQVHVIPSDIRLNLDALAEFTRQNQITDLHLPTQFGEQFMEEFESPFMKRVLIGGEKMRRRFEKSFAVYNSYGPTETTIDTNFMPVEKDYANIPIGKPSGNVYEYVLDRFGGLVPVGAPGELCISGIQVAVGYLNRPELTDEKFVPNPYAVDEHTRRMYRTGDLARWNQNGEIEHLGRIDRQVKISGYRIELGEIELALSALPGVAECTVVDLPDTAGGKFLCAYYVGQGADEAGLRAQLAESLPKYMVPEAFVALNALPLTPSGKVDRKQLPKPRARAAGPKTAPPETDTEKAIFAVWAGVLGHEDFGIDDNFFETGGNSLKAIRAVSLLKDRFDIDINRMYTHPTIRALAANSGEARFNLRGALQMAKQQMAAAPAPPAGDGATPEARRTYDEYVRKAAALDLETPLPVEAVLLCGATGYLGAFLLHTLLETTQSHVHALVRGASREDAQNRLAEKMRYYFGEAFALPEGRVTVWQGDLCGERLGLSGEDYALLAQKTSLVLNTAANVRHYGQYEEFYKSNVQSVLNLIDFCQTGAQKRLCHVSTMSVAIGYVEGKEAVAFSELDCDIGQKTDNVYIRTKLLAETEVMQAAQKGLDAQIFRVGNITPDSKRGTVQQNIEENGFFSTLKAMLNLGVMGKGSSHREFSHVDKLAEAICLLCNKKALGGQIFHLHNPNKADLGKLFTKEALAVRMEVLDDGAFLDYLAQRIDLVTTRDLIEAVLLHTGWLDSREKTTRFTVWSARTKALLDRLGFAWGDAGAETLRPMVRAAFAERTAFLASLPLFRPLPAEAVAAFAGLARMAVYEPDALLEEGKVEEFGIVQQGMVEQSMLSQQGWRGSVRLLASGAPFGYSVLSGHKIESLYEALVDEAQVLWFAEEDIDAILRGNAQVSMNLISELSRRLEQFQHIWVENG